MSKFHRSIFMPNGERQGGGVIDYEETALDKYMKPVLEEFTKTFQEQPQQQNLPLWGRHPRHPFRV